jgi:hypothetical protein
VSDQDRRRIEEEERVRAEARLKAEAEVKRKARESAVKKGFLGCLGLIGVIVLVAILGSLGNNRTPEQKAQAKCEDKTTAFVMSQSFVKKRLRAPTTADFPWITDSEVSIKYVGGCTHEVRAYVDAQNAFGAKIRNRYYVKLQNQKGTDTWSALEVQIYGQ